jgi:lipid II:glycine glycyltransferase (peptidoglycan interpeptide bridge formation enzyme)
MALLDYYENVEELQLQRDQVEESIAYWENKLTDDPSDLFVSRLISRLKEVLVQIDEELE